MTRKLLYIGLTIFALTFASIIIQSCQSLFTYEGKICIVDFTGVEQSHDNSPDKFSNEIGFLVSGSYDARTCYQKTTDFSFITPCFATTKCVEWQNDFLSSSFQISLDKQVIIDGDTIKPNTDLFLNSAFKDMTTIKKDENDCTYITMTIMLSSDLTASMAFEQGIYNVTFNCSTSDNRTFTNHRQVIFKQ